MKEFTGAQYLRRIWRWRWFIVSLSGGALLISAYVTLRFIPRTYQSEVTIIFPSSPDLDLSSLSGRMVEGAFEALSFRAPVNASIELNKGILQSRNIAQRVVEHFHLEEYYETDEVQEAVEALRKDTRIEGMGSGFLKVITTLKGTPRLSRLSEVFQREAGLERDRPVREKVAAMANFYIQALQDYSRETQLHQARTHREFLEKQVAEARRKKEAVYRQLQDLQEKEGHVSLPDEMRATFETYGNLRSSLLLAQSKVEELQTQIAEARQRLRSQMQDPLQLPAHSPLLADLRRQLNELEYDFNTKVVDMTPEHPEMQRLQVQIEEKRKELQKETSRILQAIEDGTAPELQDLEVKKSAAEAERDSLRQEMQHLEAQFAQWPAAQSKLAQLTLETEVQSKLYSLLATQLKQAEIAEDREGEPFHILDPGVAPLKHVSPQLKINLGAGTLLGLMLGIGLALGLESCRDLQSSRQGSPPGSPANPE